MTIAAMDILDAALMQDQHGLFLRREALARGVSDLMLRHALQAGVLVRVRHGAYVPAETWHAMDELAQHLLKLRAVMRTHEGRVAASHVTAAALWGMDLWKVPLSHVHVTRTDNGSGRRFKDLVHHQALVPQNEVVEREGMPVVVPVRAALEAATLVELEPALVIVCSGLRMKHFLREELEAQCRLMEAWPNSLGLDLLCRLADERLESVGEVRTYFCMWQGGLPKPEPQFKVYDGEEMIGIVDFAWPELGVIVEFDGRVKYEKYLREGEAPGDAVFREKRREDRIREVTGWIVIRVVWAELANPAALVARIRRAMSCAA